MKVGQIQMSKQDLKARRDMQLINQAVAHGLQNGENPQQVLLTEIRNKIWHASLIEAHRMLMALGCPNIVVDPH